LSAPSLTALRRSARDCRRCDLYGHATQTVFGSGPADAVKHFKWRESGKRRLHETPRAAEINACRPWLESELAAVEPSGVIAMGATAARSLFGSKIRVTRDRGRLLDSPFAPVASVTIHPSAILRLRDRTEREQALADMVEDLETVLSELRHLTQSAAG
jgi:uracil-DNA glycosylase